jgi:Fe-S cluster biogenesis protein NfuA
VTGAGPHGHDPGDGRHDRYDGLGDLRAAGDRIEQLLEELRTSAPTRTYDKAEELLRLVTNLYGGALTRVMALVSSAAPDLVDELVADDLVASLLVVHGLHPSDLSARVEGALEQVRPLLATHGGYVELLEIDEQAGAVRLRLLGNCDGCPSSSVTLRTAVEGAITSAAPEVTIFDVEAPSEPAAGDVLVEAPPADPASDFAPVALLSGPRRTHPVFDSCPSEVAL